jgi:hypothetical protein
MNECEITEIREQAGWWHFKFGNGRDFQEKVDAIKSEFIYMLERRYDPEREEWAVIANDASLEKLSSIFPNGAGAVRAMKAQLSLF